LSTAVRIPKWLATLWPVASLRAYLVAIMLIATLPVVALMGYQILRDAGANDERIGKELERSAAATAQNVERELASSTDALTILARTTLLPSAGTVDFERAVRQDARLHPTWRGVFLIGADGRLLFDSSPTKSGAVRPGFDDAAFARNDARAVITNQAGDGGAPGLSAVAVPVVAAGLRRYVLGAWIEPAAWQELLQKSGPPADGFVSLVDRQQRVMASTRVSEHPVGRTLPRRDAAAQAPGVHRTTLRDGEAVYTAWQDVPAARWAVAVSVPAAPLDAARRRAFVTTIVGLALCVVLGVYFASLVARHLVGPLRELAGAERPDPSERLAVREVATLRDALLAAHARDAAARKRLQANADEFETLFNGNPTGLAFAQDREARVVIHNPAMDALLGPATGGRAQVLHRGQVLPRDEQPLQRAAASGQPVAPMELEIVIEGEPRRHVLAQAVPLHQADGTPRGAIGTVVDITDRIRSDASLHSANQRLRDSQHLVDLAQEAGHVGFFHYHFHEDVLVCTQGQASLFGLGTDALVREDAGSWREWGPHIEREDRLRIEKVLGRVLASGQEKETIDYRVALPDGQTRWLSSRVLILYDAQRRPEQLIGVSVDVTDEKLAQRERVRLTGLERVARLEAEAASKAKDEFLAMLGHELRNPLSAISAAIEVLNRVPGDSEVAVNARNIAARQTRHLAHMMDDLLDVGRVISGKVLLARRPVELAALARRVASTFEVTGESDGHELRFDLHEVWIDADATRIEQVLANLLTNAFKYTPKGADVRIAVTHEGPNALLAVRDNGPGIPPALLPRVFDLFVQGERTPDRRAGGLGIGLTLARRLVELHGGTIEAESSSEGSTFKVRLPAVAAPVQAVDRPRAAESRARRVVLVEDNDDARDGLRTTLELDGHSVIAVGDGPSGLHAVLEHRPDAAIVDIGLPGLTGLEVARRSRAAGYGGLMIALSGYGRDSDIRKAFESGFDLHLVKPVDGHELQRLLNGA
jgi:signal transduction histidine kinase